MNTLEKFMEMEEDEEHYQEQTFIDLENRRWEWSRKIFTKATPISSLNKLKEEIEEIEDNITSNKKDASEYADALMCVFDVAARDGFTAEDLKIAFAKKLEVNLKRKWKLNSDNTYSHIK